MAYELSDDSLLESVIALENANRDEAVWVDEMTDSELAEYVTQIEKASAGDLDWCQEMTDADLLVCVSRIEKRVSEEERNKIIRRHIRGKEPSK